jgi:hypothetical protein
MWRQQIGERDESAFMPEQLLIGRSAKISEAEPGDSAPV